ncbi:hypothetical protein G7Y89_g7164 [Cudoniella acicularis]|uniref:Uncharacterized protein n=1 Tax=Cudoniella acicularis TaxID=354080 RepID=A0A8H4RJV8_9HELO|nr:hypothetical protein G7Y89_g7164 [Cudoniella acicularis]
MSFLILLFNFIAFLSALSTSVPLTSPSSQTRTTTKRSQLLNTTTITTFPKGTWLENLVICQTDGNALVTLLSSPTVLLLSTTTPNSFPPLTIATFPHTLGCLGIVELELNIFYVITGNWSAHTGLSTPGSYSIWEIDMTGAKKGKESAARTKKIADVPGGGFLNGMTVLNPIEGILLVADSLFSSVWAVNVRTGTVNLAINDTSMAPLLGASPPLGINGLHIIGSELYYDNTNKATFNKIPIDLKTGKATGEALTLVQSEKAFPDDFVVDFEGSAWMTADLYGEMDFLPGVEAAVRGDSVGFSVVAGSRNDTSNSGWTAAHVLNNVRVDKLVEGVRCKITSKVSSTQNNNVTDPDPFTKFLAKITPITLTASLELRAKGLFLAHHVFGYESKTPMFSYMRIYYPPGSHTEHGQHLVTALRSAWYSYFAFSILDSRIFQLARRSYTSALSSMNSALLSKEVVMSNSTLLAILLLDVFEQMASRIAHHYKEKYEGTEGKHLAGALAIMGVRGAEQFSDPLSVAMLQHMSSNILVNCLRDGLDVPVELLNLRAQAFRIVQPNDLQWRLAQLMVDLVVIKSRIRIGAIDLGAIHSGLLELNNEYWSIHAELGKLSTSHGINLDNLHLIRSALDKLAVEHFLTFSNFDSIGHDAERLIEVN